MPDINKPRNVFQEIDHILRSDIHVTDSGEVCIWGGSDSNIGNCRNNVPELKTSTESQKK